MILISSFVLMLAAAAPNAPPETRMVDYERQNVNQVEMQLSSCGIFARMPSNGGDGLWWPIGSGQSYIEGAGFLFGTIDPSNADTLVSAGISPHYGTVEFTPGLQGQDTSSAAVRIYVYPRIWPPPSETFPLAPSQPISHQDMWCVYNDCNINKLSGHHPIGIEVYQTCYAWTYPLVQDVIFMVFETRNVSGDTLRDNYIGIYTQMCIGNQTGTAVNDMVLPIVRREYVLPDSDTTVVDDFGYGWQDYDEPGWVPSIPGAVGFDFLQMPYDLKPGRDKDQDGILDQYERDSAYFAASVPASQWDADSDYIPDWRDASQIPQTGMSAFKRLTLNFDPIRDPDLYSVMAGHNFETGAYEPFDTILPWPDDQRFVMTAGPFDLMPDSSCVLALGIMLTYWENQYGWPDTALAMLDRWVQAVWDDYYFETGVSRLPRPEYDSTFLTVSPNPARDRVTASFTFTQMQGLKVNLFDIAGRKVSDLYEGSVSRGVYELDIDTRGLAAGTYFLLGQIPDRPIITKKLVVVK